MANQCLFRTILIPLDGSVQAETALPLARDLARALDAELVLLRAALARTADGVSPGSAQVQVVTEAEEYLARHEVALRSFGVRCRSVVPYGPAAESIVDNADLQRADLVVMSAHGGSGTSRWAHGGVADKVVGGLAAPVLLVQGETANTDQPGVIVLPLDGSDLAEALVPSAAETARAIGWSVRLLSVVPDEEHEVAEAQRYLQRVAAWLIERGIPTTTQVRSGSPAEVIVENSSLGGSRGLIAISTHGRSGIGRWAYGSVADRVIHQATGPLLLFRAPNARSVGSALVWARRCHNCGREVYRLTLGSEDTCPRCGYDLRVCANCGYYDGIVCQMENPWSRGIHAGTPCADFSFRAKAWSGAAPSGI